SAIAVRALQDIQKRRSDGSFKLSIMPIASCVNLPFYTYDSANPISTKLLPDWAVCNSDSECSDGCCSVEYSGAVFECTPGGKKCGGPGSANTLPNPASSFGDWAFCTDSIQCTNKCCSSQYSNDGKLKCTPGGSVCVNTSTKLLAD
ncbi:hypothetical protein HK096_007771, partial [Nowakowskiella sp. JEL0078]